MIRRLPPWPWTPSAQAVFLLAVEADAAARASVLERECENDTELRQRVELLLQAHGTSISLLDQPPPQLQTTHGEPSLTEGPGLRVGPYQLLQQIGGETTESLRKASESPEAGSTRNSADSSAPASSSSI